MSRPYLIFDAGGTLVFPDQAFLAQQARIHDVSLSEEQLYAGHFQLVHAYDVHVRDHGRPRNVWESGYVAAVCRLVGVEGPAARALVEAAAAYDRQRSLWTFSFPWVERTLAHLADQGYRMAVISNADGRAADILHDLGLAPYFERIFDSAVVGIEKPDPAIFKVALQTLGIKPATALYIGDIFYIDVLGANRAGVAAVHLDPLGLYAQWPGIHLRDVRQLPVWLTQFNPSRSREDLFPTHSQS